jgi:phosphate transport system protein
MESQARQALSAEIKELEHDLLEMGSRAEAMVRTAVESLTRLDPTLAYQALSQDDDIDEMDLAIENRCIKLLALQQPMAGDLRVIGTAIKMITDIERVGDLAVDIAKITLKVEQDLGETSFIDIPRIASIARAMLIESLEAYVKRDMKLVVAVCGKDDEVDELYRSLRNQIHDYMRRNPDAVVPASWLLLAIHHIERIADHAVNIAERVAFMITGKLHQSKSDLFEGA